MTRLRALLVATATALAVSSAALAKIPPCPGGRFLVLGAPIVAPMAPGAMDHVDMAGRMVSIASGCAAVKARVRATRSGTKVTARFPACDGVGAKAVFNGAITDSCRTFSATFMVRKLGLVKPVLASLSACGDGIWDPDGGEQCDGALGPCGGLCQACQCVGGATTTTTVTPTTVTSTTGGATTTSTPGGTSTTSTGGPSTTAPAGTSTTTTTGGPGTSATSTTSAVTTTTSSTMVGATTTTSTSTSSTSSSSMPMFPTTSTTSTTMAGPDLVPIGFSVPGTIVPTRGTMAVDYTIKNNGTATATASWWDYVLISTDATFGGDTAIGFYQRTSNLAAGSQYAPPTLQVTMPDLAAGSYYLFLQADGANAVAESNNNNNVAGPLAITVTNGDLTPTAFSASASSAPAGSQISVSYTVKNQSTSLAIGPWEDRVVLSTNTAYDAGDTVIGAFSQTFAGANGTYSATQSVTLPSVAPGAYYLLFKTDGGDQTHETSETNNVATAWAITIN